MRLLVDFHFVAKRPPEGFRAYKRSVPPVSFPPNHPTCSYRTEQLQSKGYAASPGFLSSFGWGKHRNGHVLVDKSTSENATVSVVGRVLETHLDCGPTGNFRKGKFGGLETAKFHLLLGKLTGTSFAEYFDKVLINLSKAQADIAASPNRLNLILIDGRDKQLRFTARATSLSSGDTSCRV